MNRSIAVTVSALALALPYGASAQSSYIAPSVTVGIAYDDNIFSSSTDEQEDLILRITPVFEAGFRSARGETRLLHSFDAEKYQDHTDLDSFNTRRYTEIDFDYRMTQRLDVTLLATTAATDFPGDLLPEFGLELGRVDARRTTVSPAFDYRFTPRTSFIGGLDLARDRVAGGRTVDTRMGHVGTAHRTTPRDTWSVEFERRDYDFRPGGEAYSNVLLFGWTGDVSPRTTLTVRAGPRDTEVGTEPEVFLGMDYAIPGGDFAMNYERSERVILGQAGLAETHAFWAMYTHPLTPAFAVRFVPSFTSMSRGDESAETYRFRFEANYEYTRLMSFTASYQWMRQSGSLEILEPVEFTRNVVFFGATIAFAPRVGEVPLAEARRRR